MSGLGIGRSTGADSSAVAQSSASRRCVESVGFRLDSPEPDHDGLLYYRHDRAIIHNS